MFLLLSPFVLSLFFSYSLQAESTSQNLRELKIEGTCTSLYDFTKQQQEVIFYAYYYGKEYGFGYLMAAIAWKESCAGEYLINFADPSAGIYHAYIPAVIKKYTKYKDSAFLRNVIGQILISDATFASSVALDSLRYWAKIHNGNEEYMIKSYNKGFAWQKSQQVNKLAQSYYLDIQRKIKQLESYIPAHIQSYKLKTPKIFSIK